MLTKLKTSGASGSSKSSILKVENRVDQRLLNNLQQLGDVLVSSAYGLNPEVAHSLIGKYIYIRYLKDRKILSAEWLEHRGISLEDVLGRNATLNGLSKLVEALEDRFNGKVFPLPFVGPQAPRTMTLSSMWLTSLLATNPMGNWPSTSRSMTFRSFP